MSDHRECSTCGLDAEWQILDVDPSKGDLACTVCVNRFWPMARIKRLETR